MINSLEIEEFRMFRDRKFELGKRITVFAGQNATGKSTLLGLLGNMVESKEKNIFGKQYRTEFSEIFKASNNNDKTGEHKGKVNFCKANKFDKITSSTSFRSTWQNDNTRFRIIPSRENEKGEKTESKYPLPVLYLGLSRLYPLGEVGNSKINHKDLKLTPKEKNELFDNYRYILSQSEKIEDFSNMNAQQVKSTFTGIKTKSYDELCNSSGQDNLGQILLSLISFERLYDQKKENWDGGLLLIDELDTTLHPSAQKRLLDFLFKKSKKINLQIIFTTHSETILYYIANKYEDNKIFSNDYKLFFISTANKKMKIYENPSKKLMKNNLLGTSSKKSRPKKILIYSEDDLTRWFLKKLIYGYNNRLKILKVNLGWSDLEKLLKEDNNYFSTVLFVVDGDVKNINEPFVKRENVIALVGTQRPENIIYDYLNNDKCKFWDEINEETGFTNQYLIGDSGPFSNKYNDKKKDKDKYKSWFNDFESEIKEHKVFDKWKKENVESVNEFRTEFIRKFNRLAIKQGIKPIQKPK